MEKNIDERQHLIRGKIFKHTVIVIIALLLLESLLQNFFDITFFEGMWSKLFIVLFGIVYMGAEMVIRDAFPLSENKRIGLFSLLGIFGIIVLIIGIVEFVQYGESFTTGKALSQSAALFVMSGLFIASAVIFFIKFIINKNKKDDDETEGSL